MYGISVKTVHDIWVGSTWYRVTCDLDPDTPICIERLLRSQEARPTQGRQGQQAARQEGSGSRSRASCTPLIASALRRRSCCLAGRAADASARGKAGASEGRLKTLVTCVITRHARSHHIGWHCNKGGGGSTSRPWMGWVCVGLSCRLQPGPLVSQHVPSHPAATDPTAPAVHAVTVRARRDAPCEL